VKELATNSVWTVKVLMELLAGTGLVIGGNMQFVL
jgi:hypothetical protein